jgi:hypothetical protein
MAKAPFNKKKTFRQQIGLKFKEETSKVLHLEHSFVWCWRRMDVSWTNFVQNEVLHRVKEETNILLIIKRRKANWIGHILHRNCLLKHIIK